MNTSDSSKIKLVVFDLAGTTVDHGCIAPVAAFVKGFKDFGVEITIDQARGPMGMEKRAHIQALTALPDVAGQWRSVHGRDIDDQDIDAMYRAFVPALLHSLPAHCGLVPGLLPCLEKLDKKGIRYAATTGYFREAADIVLDYARQAGFMPQVSCCATDVPAGRPAPWMIFRCMEAQGVYPPAAVVNVGDTPVDVESGRHAGCWSVGVTATGNAVGLGEQELTALPPHKRKELLQKAEQGLRAAGAQYVIESVADLPRVVSHIENLRVNGRQPCESFPRRHELLFGNLNGIETAQD